MELSVAGGDSFKLKERFANFQNVPELLKMFHTFADVKTAEDLQLPTPDLVEREDGKGTAAQSGDLDLTCLWAGAAEVRGATVQFPVSHGHRVSGSLP